MGFLLGMDEAGYGPNLGPLVISGTLWHVPDNHSLRELANIDLYQQFRGRVSVDVPKPSEHDRPSKKVWIADSKRLYKPGGGLRHLEHGVLGSLQAVHHQTVSNADSGPSSASSPDHTLASWSKLWRRLSPQSASAIRQSPWYGSFDERLPVDALPQDIQRAAETLADAFSTTKVRLLAIRSAVVFPQEFNELLAIHGNKSQILSETTLRLVTQLFEELPGPGPVFVNCDKHGGRNRYSSLIQAEFPDTLIEIREESRPISIYRFGHDDQRVEMRFQAKGEAFLPTALASMASKYLRELAMRAFNQFWRQQVDGLRPTAGYPVDARRFHGQIKSAQKRLKIGDAELWRRK